MRPPTLGRLFGRLAHDKQFKAGGRAGVTTAGICQRRFGRQTVGIVRQSAKLFSL